MDDTNWTNLDNLSAQQCIECARSCVINRDKRDCVLLWLNRALWLMEYGTRGGKVS